MLKDLIEILMRMGFSPEESERFAKDIFIGLCDKGWALKAYRDR